MCGNFFFLSTVFAKLLVIFFSKRGLLVRYIRNIFPEKYTGEKNMQLYAAKGTAIDNKSNEAKAVQGKQ